VNYLPWAVLSLVAYSAVPPLVSAATSGEGAVPTTVAVLVSNGILVVVALGLLLWSGDSVAANLDHPKFPLVVVAGVFLTVGILAYYRALALGPVSVVTPVFATFLVGSAVVGVVFLDETVTARKALAAVFALVAVYLASG
jgi:transporter family protein